MSVCTGLFDDKTETPDDYRELLADAAARNLFMICANPDIVVERGERLVYCAGAIADLYAAHRRRRDLCRQAAIARSTSMALASGAQRRAGGDAATRVLAIGDSVRTDLKGAPRFGVDCLFVTAGIHAEELGGRDDPDPAALNEMFAAPVAPKAVMRRLVW